MRTIVLAMAGLLAASSVMGSAQAAAPRLGGVCCRVPAGTMVKVELVDEVGTKTHKAGDTFAIRLAEPLVVRGRIVAPMGAAGVGEVVDASKPGMGGKAAKLVLAAKYLTQGSVRVPLQGLQVSAVGQGQANAANVVGVAGIAFAPLGFAALAIRGGDVVLPAGTGGMAKVSAAVILPTLRMAPASLANSPRAPTPAPGAVAIPPPPAGRGQVVFFRAKSLMGTGQWFNVREDGKALGKLVNGAYFVQVTAPGAHVYTAKTEPEFKDTLKLQVDPGETYYVEGVLTHGVVIGAADLVPSQAAAFDKASKDLKPAPPPEEDKPKTAAN